jgi:hypothetical protein
LRRLSEELDVTAVQEVVAARDKYFFGHRVLILGTKIGNC